MTVLDSCGTHERRPSLDHKRSSQWLSARRNKRRLDAFGGKGETRFAKLGLYRGSVRKRCSPGAVALFVFYMAPPWSGCSANLAASLRCKRSATRTFARVSSPDASRQGTDALIWNLRVEEMPSRNMRCRRTAVCHDRSLLAFQRRPPAGDTHVRVSPRRLQFFGRNNSPLWAVVPKAELKLTDDR